LNYSERTVVLQPAYVLTNPVVIQTAARLGVTPPQVSRSRESPGSGDDLSPSRRPAWGRIAETDELGADTVVDAGDASADGTARISVCILDVLA